MSYSFNTDCCILIKGFKELQLYTFVIDSFLLLNIKITLEVFECPLIEPQKPKKNRRKWRKCKYI